jgi:ketosteroid isomerase-like protein
MAGDGIADVYVEAINTGSLEAIVALFSPDAVLSNPAGTFTGLDEIRSFYESIVLAGKAQLTVRAVRAGGDRRVTAELVATSPLGQPGNELVAVDDFVLSDDGRIRSLDIVYR